MTPPSPGRWAARWMCERAIRSRPPEETMPPHAARYVPCTARPIVASSSGLIGVSRASSSRPCLMV
eukprot:scaffold15374_cov129-Isochrysis_galbana.AAC.2